MPENSLNLRSFGRRHGRKLRTHAQELVDDFLPTIQISRIAEVQKCKKAEDLSAFLNLSNSAFYLEIGFGGGEHLAHIASLQPEISMIGCEPYVNGISGLLKQIEEQKLTNIRIFTDDVRELLAVMPDACLQRVYILYPDPWPKSRHHKRRLIQKPLLDALARVMKQGAELRIATDWDDYTTWILEHAMPHTRFSWQAENAKDWTQPWADWIETRYEAKAKREGRKSVYLRFIRSDR